MVTRPVVGVVFKAFETCLSCCGLIVCWSFTSSYCYRSALSRFPPLTAGMRRSGLLVGIPANSPEARRRCARVLELDRYKVHDAGRRLPHVRSAESKIVGVRTLASSSLPVFRCLLFLSLSNFFFFFCSLGRERRDSTTISYISSYINRKLGGKIKMMKKSKKKSNRTWSDCLFLRESYRQLVQAGL